MIQIHQAVVVAVAAAVVAVANQVQSLDQDQVQLPKETKVAETAEAVEMAVLETEEVLAVVGVKVAINF
jgi:hypothetical protein